MCPGDLVPELLNSLDLRQAWDDKWEPGRHAPDIANLKRAIEKLDEWISLNCCR